NWGKDTELLMLKELVERPNLFGFGIPPAMGDCDELKRVDKRCDCSRLGEW
nr:hypothetical protein [Tanacetum cinerariifolium]